MPELIWWFYFDTNLVTGEKEEEKNLLCFDRDAKSFSHCDRIEEHYFWMNTIEKRSQFAYASNKLFYLLMRYRSVYKIRRNRQLNQDTTNTLIISFVNAFLSTFLKWNERLSKANQFLSLTFFICPNYLCKFCSFFTEIVVVCYCYWKTSSFACFLFNLWPCKMYFKPKQHTSGYACFWLLHLFENPQKCHPCNEYVLSYLFRYHSGSDITPRHSICVMADEHYCWLFLLLYHLFSSLKSYPSFHHYY